MRRTGELSAGDVTRRRLYIVLIFFGLSLVARVLRLDFFSLWYDEISTAALVEGRSFAHALDAVLGATGSETLHPLYYVLLAGWLRVAGDSVWALRLPSVLFGSCAVAIYVAILCRVVGKRGLLFGSLLIVAPFLVWYARDARPYSLILFCSSLHMLFYLRLTQEPRSRMDFPGFVVTGAFMIYSGIFTGMLLLAELAWGSIRRKRREVMAVLLVLLAAAPMVWHGYRTFFQRSSDRHRELPTGISVVRIVGFPQEFLVGRSFGPTPDEVRQFPLGEVVRENSLEIGVEILSVLLICVALAGCARSVRLSSSSNQGRTDLLRLLAFLTVAVCVQAALLIVVTGYQMNARHIAFAFGPLFVVAVYPVAKCQSRVWQALFVVPLLLLWSWSSANQIFDSSYVPEDFKNAAKTIVDSEYSGSNVVALCNYKGLRYYGVSGPLVYIRESSEVTIDTIQARLEQQTDPFWLVVARPWNYPNLREADMGKFFHVRQTKTLPGIRMWLMIPEADDTAKR